MNSGHSKNTGQSAVRKYRKSYIPTQRPIVFLPSTVDGLYDKIDVLLGELDAGNATVKPIIIAILNKLKEKGALKRSEAKKPRTQIQDSATSGEDSESEESRSEMEETNAESDVDDHSEDKGDEEFDQLILDVADTVSQNEKKNLQHALSAVEREERKQIESWLEGEKSLEKILPLLKDTVDMMKIKILMKEMDERRKKVDKVLHALRNITDFSELKDTLDGLRSQDVITDGEYKRLIVANHDLQSYVNAFQGRGIWL